VLEIRERDAFCTIGATRSSLQVLTQLRELLQLKFGNHDATPCIACADRRRVHELEHRPFAECMANDLGGSSRCPTWFRAPNPSTFVPLSTMP
jgi:hypothetical protein